MIEASEYPQFLAALKATIRQRQYQALRAVNHELLALYLEIGEAIYHKQEELGWGKSVVENLARDLQAEFPGRNGFSARNLWNMRDLYFSYRELPKLQPLVAEISWAKNLVILARCKDALQREFYLRARRSQIASLSGYVGQASRLTSNDLRLQARRPRYTEEVMSRAHNPYGDGQAACRIREILLAA